MKCNSVHVLARVQPMRQSNKKYILRNLFQGIFLHAWGTARKPRKPEATARARWPLGILEATFHGPFLLLQEFCS